MTTERPKRSFFRRDDANNQTSTGAAPESSRNSNYKDSRPARPARSSENSRDSRPSRDSRDSRPARDSRPSRDSRDSRDSRATQDSNFKGPRPERGERAERGERSENRGERGGARSPFTKNSERPAYNSERPSYNKDRKTDGDRGSKPAYAPRGERSARSFDSQKSERTPRTERTEWTPRTERPERSEWTPRTDRSERAPRSEGAERAPRKPFNSSNRPAYDHDRKPFEGRDGHSSRNGRAEQGQKVPYGQRPERVERPRYTKKEERPAYAHLNPEDPTNQKDQHTQREQVITGPIRLNRFISMSGICSRREADELISAGQVTVNGEVTTTLGAKVMVSDTIELDGKVLKGEKKVYIVMNKPKGYVTTTEDPHADRTVIDLLKGLVKERVYPVGRLDKNTTGVLLLTNDGDLTKELTHPSYEKSKLYHAFLDKDCTEEHLETLAKGVELEDGPIHADEISFVEGQRDEVGIEIHSGRNRIVRRMFEHLGYEVVRLDRVHFAGMGKMGLRRGFWRYLTPREVATLKGNSYK